MRCRTCNYVLWRLRARTCPECGAGFLPSEYEFERNSVRFRCPHCSQEYYGTDARGLLTPRAFECVRCAAAIQMDEMVLEPAAGLPDESPFRANPWLDPRRQNRLMRWLRTVGMSLGRPAELARGTPDGRHGRALWFAVRSNVSYALIGWIVPFVLLGVVMTGLFAQSGGPFSGVWWVAGVLFAWVAGTLVVGVAALGVWALAAHGLLRVTGGTERRLGATWNCICYASGAHVFAGVPCLGLYAMAVAWIWPAISGAIMLHATHRVAPWRAALAAILPPLLVCGVVGGVYGALFVSAMRIAQSSTATMSGATSHGVGTAFSVRTAYALSHEWDGRDFRGHAANLVADGLLDPAELVPFSGASLTFTPLVDGYSLEDLEGGAGVSPERREAARAAFLAATPADAPAYRLGDVVFVRPAPGEHVARLWSAIVMPEGGAVLAGDWITTVDGHGTPRTLEYPDEFKRALEAQNALRASHGLPALADPGTVGHDQRPVGDGAP